MSPNTERLSLAAAALVATLAWPCLEETAAGRACQVALAGGAGRIAPVPAAGSPAVAPAGSLAGHPRAHRTAAKPPHPPVAAARQA